MMPPQIDLPAEQIAAFCQRHHIRRLALFGSVLGDDFGPDSDVDVLVEFEPEARIGYFDLAEIQFGLVDLFGRPVDVGTPDMLSPYIKSGVLQSAQVIYEHQPG
jgi:hypothetical protein